MLDVAGQTLLNLDDKRHLYYVVLAALVGTYALLALIQASRFGHALAGIRVNEQRMPRGGLRDLRLQARGLRHRRCAGRAGGIPARGQGRRGNPELLSWHESGAVMLMMILGGIGSLRGAVIGAIAFTLLKELYQSEALVGALAGHWQMHARTYDHCLRRLAAQGSDRPGKAWRGCGSWLRRCSAPLT